MPEVQSMPEVQNKITKTDAEWREALSALAYQVTRKHATEQAFSHEDFPAGPGVYHCICCGAPLFGQNAKFDSGSGWPSFFAPLARDAIAQREDRGLFRRRTEVHCATCEAHLGHVFPDGPAPTGLRYCMNGVALRFETDASEPATNADGQTST